MTTLRAEIEINAPKKLVWQALTVKENWIYWNTFLFDCDPDQPLAGGKEIFLAFSRLPREEQTEFEARITFLQPEVCLKWVSSIPGLTNEYVFELQEIGVRRTQYVHQNRFYGMLKPIFFPFIRDDELLGIKRMAKELKRYVETADERR